MLSRVVDVREHFHAIFGEILKNKQVDVSWMLDAPY